MDKNTEFQTVSVDITKEFKDVPLSEYLCKWEVFPLMGVYLLIGVDTAPPTRG